MNLADFHVLGAVYRPPQLELRIAPLNQHRDPILAEAETITLDGDEARAAARDLFPARR